ncbi:uncharacterized protein LOC125512955 [Triticum urartu]|uniref:uncharacterized protein LOC125512955 n=1 Tax=Triticum urartu TaxID=4572 RepID=UPI000844E391|nr:uncharacterized protein LOC125512955 [Triticum urartu]
MATARCAGGWSAPARVLVLLLCALLCAIALVAVVPLAAPPGEGAASLPRAASSSFPVAAGGRRASAGPGRSRARRWNSAGLVDSKHEVPSGPNPDSNR